MDTRAFLFLAENQNNKIQQPHIMILYNFDGYEGFKEIFGRRNHENGVQSRRNQILLALYKHKPYIQWCKAHYAKKKGLSISNMAQLKDYCLKLFAACRFDLCESLYLQDRAWGSNVYKTDNMKGKTVDGDSKAIRYVRQDNGKVYKMKAGKMYRNLILETDFGKCLPEQVVVWLCEELAAEWAGYNVIDQYTLHVDEDFERIYSSEYLKGDFGSCMTNRGHHYFYSNSVKAKAAYITDETEKIVARAVIYTDVTDSDNNKWRLCERQYSYSGDDQLKQVLVNLLIQGGYIDGYKRVGADCHNASAFVDCNGKDLSDKCFHIECNLGYDDTISYQDSFKWYDMDDGIAYNYDADGADHLLSTTDRTLDDDRNYDNYHDCYTHNDVLQVYYHGNWVYCDEYRLEDFQRIDGEWYHDDDVSTCDECGGSYRSDTGYYSVVTDEYYCCESCREAAEQMFCENNPDIYRWIHGQAVPVEDLVTCPHCGHEEPDWCENFIHSDITGEDYCCDSCLEAAEMKFIKDNPDCGYAVCDECGDICASENLTYNSSTDSRMCPACLQYAENLELL